MQDYYAFGFINNDLGIGKDCQLPASWLLITNLDLIIHIHRDRS